MVIGKENKDKVKFIDGSEPAREAGGTVKLRTPAANSRRGTDFAVESDRNQTEGLPL